MKKLYLALTLVLVCLTATAQVPADSVGIFALVDSQAVRMDKITHNAIKGSGGLASAATFGMAKIKSKLQFKGNTSPNHFKGTATFRMYFGTPQTTDIVNLYQFSANYSAKDFEVARFDVKKNTRTLTGVSFSLLGSSVGVSSADDLSVTVKELRPKVYDITVTGKPGEYCFMFVANGTNGFGGVYDFTIE